MTVSTVELSSTPKRNLLKSTSPKVGRSRIGSTKQTPVRSVKRTRGDSFESNYNDVVESEFYRSFSDKTKKDKKYETESELSFLFRGATNNIGTSTVGMYGEISHSGLKAVCKKLVEYGLDEKSVVLDLGSGRGVPNFLFASDANTYSSIGIEKCPIAYLNSINNICIHICRQIKKIRTDIEDSPNRSPTGSDYNSYLSNSYSSTELCESSPSTNSPNGLVLAEDDYDLSVTTQLEEDENVFDENSVTPTRFLKEPNLSNKYGLEDIQQGLKEFKNKPPSLPVAFVNEDITAYDSFEGVTHFYSFDFAMERALINNMVYQFKNTSTAYVFASFIPDLINGFELTGSFLAAKVPCKMYGSNEGKTCYVYVKNNWKRIKANADKNLLKLLTSTSECNTGVTPNSKNTTSNNNKNTNKNKRRKKTPEPETVSDCSSDSSYLSFDVNNYDEPYTSLDIIKLSRMPLYYQYMWYLRRLDRYYGPFVTRSQSVDSVHRESLATERDDLIEQIANVNTVNSHEPRRKLKQHISNNFKRTSSFP